MPSPPRRVLLWGSRPEITDYLVCLHDVGIEVAAAVDIDGTGFPASAIPVLTVEQFGRRRDEFSCVPVVALAGRPGNPAPLTETIESLLASGIAPERILDPAFISDRLRLDFAGRVFICGFPGSGNFLLRAIVEALTKDRSPPLSGRELLVSVLHANRYNSLIKVFRSVLHAAGARIVNIGPYDPGCVSAHAYTPSWGDLLYKSPLRALRERTPSSIRRLIPLPRHLDIYDIPARPAFFTSIHADHNRVDERFIEFYARTGYDVFVIVRHPLDVLVSVSAKHTVQMPRYLLDDHDYFESMCVVLSDYYSRLATAREHVTVVRYEDLLMNPGAEITSIAAQLGIECSTQRANDIWKDIGFKPLVTVAGAGRHLWQPGGGKWRRYFTRKHADILARTGLPAVMESFDYQADLSSLPTNREPLPRFTRVDDLPFSGGYDLNVRYGAPYRLPSPKTRVLRTAVGGMRYVSNAPRLIRAIDILDREPSFRALVGSLPPLPQCAAGGD